MHAGGTGLTAYVGFRLFGDIRPGKTIYISGAAGATGYVIAQIAKIKGLRVIGSTGDDAKVLFLMETAGIDAAFNYKKISVDEALSEYAPDGIDFFFDNVGGETLEATINHANTHARFILCGAISGYNQSDEERYGVKNLFKVVSKRLDIKGFLVSEAAPPFIEDFHREVVGWVKSGELVVSDSVVEGIENTPKALVDMLQGKNLGKQHHPFWPLQLVPLPNPQAMFALRTAAKTHTILRASLAYRVAPFSSANSPAVQRISDIRPRRALFYVPGSDERKLHKSITLGADCIVYDLEDSVAFNKKGTARKMVIDALEVCIIVPKIPRAFAISKNLSDRLWLRLGLEYDDLNVVAIVIPKVQSAKDVQFVVRMIDSVAPESTEADIRQFSFITSRHEGCLDEPLVVRRCYANSRLHTTLMSHASRHNIRLIPSIESGLGIINLREIASADPRVDALIFAAEDYCADLGLIRTPSRTEMLYARQAVVTAASAFGLQAIDLVCLDFQNQAILEEECREGREFGFMGKQAIHPNQVEIIQKTFLPDPAAVCDEVTVTMLGFSFIGNHMNSDIERAAKIIEGYELHSQKGVGAFNLDGKMIDLPVVKWASKVLARAKAAGLTISGATSSGGASKASADG
ncbi:hypothetical protein BC938DRAFT_477106 [Jimgerdemannia flammicorona]|uniref:Pyruvate/Phosphoenolpyruvate kinase-like domain-containing protein n=1 Tax=Jimgerdemannia flammicorona TaxID=994334 RepID=A0A433QPR4_9FUNG|nr:hypothetical protein BC938DRAFT_477106 [Jimgerdemannia flammicorona]